ncbi:hypothetical protein PK98_10490 [Croceibacterium mercuriale]|uniref:DUF924 domain-containing protein n=1 Tax=Croceibacterium mercuriale TaxID=1572751 RepID=A0A0B2BU26_9SPHN|nr:hypothetical protein PK98_10490 [Croceibacterium mercuriale]
MEHFWFRRLNPGQWFDPDDAVDAELRRRFAPDLAALWTQAPHSFLTDPHTALAAVLLFDQLPRNLFRGTSTAFAFDPLAQRITHGALARGFDRVLRPEQRVFLAMPLMHSEQIADQLRSLRFFTRLGLPANRAFAVDHYRMIARFGRFPHRNDALGRTSTPAEQRAVEQGFAW